jgi:hypothetical protein
MVFESRVDMDNKEIHKLVKDMNEATELVFLEEIIKKRVARLRRKE